MHDPRTDPLRGEAGSVQERIDEILGSGSDLELALVERMVSGFPRKSAHLLTSALDAAAAGDGAAAGQWIHRLHGAAANLGALALPRLCDRTERLAAAGDCDAVIRHRTMLEDAVAALLPLLEQAWSGVRAGAFGGG